MVNWKVIETEDIKDQINRWVLITEEWINSEIYLKNAKTPIERFLLEVWAFYKYAKLVVYSVKYIMDTAEHTFERSEHQKTFFPLGSL